MSDIKPIVFGSQYTQPTQQTQVTQPKAVTVTPKTVKPVVVAPTTSKGGGKPVAKDPKNMFDYSNCKTYVVKDGDTLFDIAQKYTIALQQLRYFNHLDRNTFAIKTGQTIYIPNKPVYVPTGK